MLSELRRIPKTGLLLLHTVAMSGTIRVVYRLVVLHCTCRSRLSIFCIYLLFLCR